MKKILCASLLLCAAAAATAQAQVVNLHLSYDQPTTLTIPCAGEDAAGYFTTDIQLVGVTNNNQFVGSVHVQEDYHLTGQASGLPYEGSFRATNNGTFKLGDVTGGSRFVYNLVIKGGGLTYTVRGRYVLILPPGGEAQIEKYLLDTRCQ